MSQENENFPAARNWREISQAVKPRAMSRGGRWRLAMTGVRLAALAGIFGGVAWGAWLVVASLQKNPKHIPAAAKLVPMKAPELETTRDGVLDDAWLARTLGLPPGIALMELDLARLRARLLSDQQVLTANLTLLFPDRLKVRITERTPIARIRFENDGVRHDLVAARDGVVFFGTGFDRAMLDSLPWLDGLGLAPDGLGFRAMADLDPVARLLADAQFSAPHLYCTWHTVSLARLAADRELEVTMKNGTTAVFGAKGEFFLQFAKLNHIVEQLARVPHARARIDLSLGREVPVTIEPLAPDERRLPGAKPGTPPFPFLLLPLPGKNQT